MVKRISKLREMEVFRREYLGRTKLIMKRRLKGRNHGNIYGLQ